MVDLGTRQDTVCEQRFPHAADGIGCLGRSRPRTGAGLAFGVWQAQAARQLRHRLEAWAALAPEKTGNRRVIDSRALREEALRDLARPELRRQPLRDGGAGRASDGLWFPSMVRAADHGDAPNIDNDAGADIADVFAFLDPNDNTKVVIIGTVHGFIVPGD